MSTHNIGFYEELSKIIKYSSSVKSNKVAYDMAIMAVSAYFIIKRKCFANRVYVFTPIVEISCLKVYLSIPRIWFQKLTKALQLRLDS